MLNHYYHHPQFKRAEHIAISLEENLIHPIITIQTIILKVWDVLINLHDIQSEIIIEVGYLNIKKGGFDKMALKRVDGRGWDAVKMDFLGSEWNRK
jgi:hypothetical protein